MKVNEQRTDLVSGIFKWYILGCLCFICSCSPQTVKQTSLLKAGFLNPPDTAKPGVYWYFMDGNMTKESMTKDLASMKKAGLGNLIFLEVNVGVPRGNVDFLSKQWQELFAHAIQESARLGIEVTLGIGPGWAGSGGPWVSAAQSMQHLVSSSVIVQGNKKQKINLSRPKPKNPYFGEGAFTPELKRQWLDFYEDVAVLAYPSPSIGGGIADIDEKALYYRAPYTSVPDVKPYFLVETNYNQLPAGAVIDKGKILDLSNRLKPDGTLDWVVPEGNWTIVRFGRTNNGAVTRPAPFPGLGFEADKFDTVAINAHLDHYIGTVLKKTERKGNKLFGGLKRIHIDSWEMGAQNWTGRFREEFINRRRYDPLPYYPVYNGSIVESLEVSERFLWDLRQTSQDLILEYHAKQVKKYGAKNGLELSIEPYDMNPTADLELGAIADVPMGEFWSKDLGFNSSWSIIEAASIGHVNGSKLIPAEAFTAQNNEGWKQHPGSMKDQGDWAFAAGVNRFVYHTFQNQVLADSLLPGMTMGPYGVHWDRSQTWWPMVGDYHNYISRCQFILQQGNTVADVLYLTPEGAPHVFQPPSSAMEGTSFLKDRKGYNFDGCAPGQLFKASVQNNKIIFPGGASYHVLVLPAVKAMTPAILEKIQALIKDGATIIGAPPETSLGLSGYPESEAEIQSIVQEVWGGAIAQQEQETVTYGKGKVIWGGDIARQIDQLYPQYDATSKILKEMDIQPDFQSGSGSLRYTHRATTDYDIYFVANRTNQKVTTHAEFRSVKGVPQLWNPLTGEIKSLPEYIVKGGITSIPLTFDSYQSFFIMFSKENPSAISDRENFTDPSLLVILDGPWNVAFDKKWGGPENVTFDALTDWTLRPEEGIKYYSGTAVYRKTFELPIGDFENKSNQLFLDLGEVKNLARIKLNGKDLGVVWTAPWKVDITNATKKGMNQLEVEVVNLWPNRLIGDEKLPYDGIKDGQWPEWLTKNQPRSSGRYTFTTYQHYHKDAQLLKSGLIGPVTIQIQHTINNK